MPPSPAAPASAATSIPSDVTGDPRAPAHDGRGPTRVDALRRIAAKVSGRRDPSGLFDDVIDEAVALFGVDRAGLWRYDAASERPLSVAAHRGLAPEILEAVTDLPRDARTIGMTAIRDREVRILGRAMRSTTPRLRDAYTGLGIQTVCFVPLVFGDDPIGLLVLYHHEPYRWSADERALARTFGDHMATAIAAAGLAESQRSLADRLASIADLAGRLGHLQDLEGIADAIVAEARGLIDHDTIRVYRVDHGTGWCEPIAFTGTFLGSQDPHPDTLRVRVGEGLTGWVAEHGRPLRMADARTDPRSLVMGSSEQPESMLLVPMTYEDAVHGVLVVSALGAGRFDADDETTLAIFAAHAAHAIVNGANLERLRQGQAELELQLEGQRRLLEVNARLLSTLDPVGVLDLIADSLKAIVPYDSMTIYRVDHEADVRRAVLARDRYADEIIADEGPILDGITGWVIAHGEAVLSNQAHLDPRSTQVPGTPFEPESMISVPLQVHGEVIGTLNIGRIGEAEAAFSPNEFELTQLFAGQASIALQNAQAHGEVQVRAEHDALTGLRNHGAFQRELGDLLTAAARNGDAPFAVLMLDLDAFKAFNDAMGHPAGDALLVDLADTMTTAMRQGDRLYRYGGDEFAALLIGTDHLAAHDVAGRIRRAVGARSAAVGGPLVGVSVGVACYPDDGQTKDELVAIADRALFQAKPAERTRPGLVAADPYLRALDETALALLDRRDQDGLLEAVVARATTLLGTPHGIVHLLDPDSGELVLRVGTGVFAPIVGHRMRADAGLAGAVLSSGRPLAVDDYEAWPKRTTGAAGFATRRRRRRAPRVGRPGHRHPGPGRGLDGPDVDAARHRCPDELRQARRDRPRQRAPRGRRRPRCPVRPHHGSAESRIADRPDRPRAGDRPARRRRDDGRRPLQPRPVHGHQRDARPHDGRPTPGGRRQPAQTGGIVRGTSRAH